MESCTSSPVILNTINNCNKYADIWATQVILQRDMAFTFFSTDLYRSKLKAFLYIPVAQRGAAVLDFLQREIPAFMCVVPIRRTDF